MNTYKLLSFLHFFCFLVYIYLACFILFKNSRLTLNKVVSALLVCFSIWHFQDIIIQDPGVTEETARLIRNISSFGWIFFSSFFLWFALIFTRRVELLKNNFLYPGLFVLPSLFFYVQYKSSSIIAFVKEPYGWSLVWGGSFWPHFYYVYYISFLLLSIYLLIDFRNKADKTDIKTIKQSNIIIVTTLVSFVLGTLTDVILPKLGIYRNPTIANVIILIWAFGLAYAIAKYKLFVLNPSTAASDIIETMNDALFLLDSKGMIKTINNAALDIFKYRKNELLEKPLDMLTEKKGGLLKDLMKLGKNKNLEVTCISKDKDIIPMLFSSAIIRNIEDDILGIVCVGHDITEQKEVQDIIQRAKNDLEIKINERTTELSKANQMLKELIVVRERAQEELRLSVSKLKKTLNGTVQSIASMIESRDLYTSGHQKRVAQLAVAIARCMKLPEDQVEGISVAATLHDLGKIQVPAEILSKPGRLNKMEYDLVKNHCRVGYEILKDIEFPWPIAHIILQHHEHIDGSGYPDGIKEDKIFLEAKIICVADVVEAISSHRPYRPSMGTESACNEIKCHKGNFYDSDVVDICLDLFHNKNFEFK
ncbi:MAG: HD domain-containing protein [Elusimicrobia bacterium]|nr:HD domain-containing protein [Candidatus Liberimonas magnetica]